jgi:hypothetical protein
MTSDIKGEQRSIGGVFSDEFEFQIPPYQRPYLWETEHAGDLMDDLLGFMGETNTPVNSLDPYFLGSIVLIKNNSPESQIVDGQQRLVTLTILLSVLRALVPNEYTDGITKRIYEAEDRVAGLAARFRLHPKAQDASFFERYIQREGGLANLKQVNLAELSDSRRHIAENALYIYDQLAQIPQERRIRLVQFIIQRCLVIIVSTPDLNAAFRIFTVLNDRGLDLDAADILKADIIGRISTEQQQSYTYRWEEIEEDLGRSDFEALLRHILTLNRGPWRKETNLEDFRRFVVQKINDPIALIDTTLVPYADVYATIRDEDYQSAVEADGINTSLHWLNRIPNTNWTPAAMEYLSRYKFDPSRLGAFFRDLERLAVGLMLTRATFSKRTQRYGLLLDAIRSGDNLSNPASPLQLTIDECHNTLNVLTGNVYKQYANVCRYLLLRLDSLLSSGDAVYSYPVITIEHVLPQTPAAGSEWLTWFPTVDLRNQWVHRLGNLALLSRRKNIQAGRMTFEKKKTTYFTTSGGVSSFALTTQVLRESEWTPAVVQRRQDELVKLLRNLWRL